MGISNLEIENLMRNVNKIKQFSGVVLIKENNEIVFEKAYGYLNRSDKIENTVNTRFGIASGCKIFTAVAICQLVEKGLISFDTLLKDCLNIKFPLFDKSISIHHLLTHSSGMPDYFDEDTMNDYSLLWNDTPMYLVKEPKNFLPKFQNEKMKFHPGDKFNYSNAGFILLGLIIEQQSGMNFTEYIEKNIFEPCGMKESGYFSLDKLPRNTAYGYIENEIDGTWRTNIYSIPIIGGPDGGAFVTAHDMINFWKGLFDNRLLKSDFAQKLLTPYISAGNDVYYGYGIWINKIEDEIFKYHLMGGDPGVSFRSAIYPKIGIEVVVIDNKEYGSYAITKEIEKITWFISVYKEVRVYCFYN
jgi:CubicO group peptidase (beta-lactamase class C family)